MRLAVGGKELDASLVLEQLRVATVGLAFLAGDTGSTLLELAKKCGLVVAPVWADGQTRTAYIITESETGRSSHIFAGGLVIDEGQRDAFLERFDRYLPEADWVICGGVLPPVVPATFYRLLVERAHAADVPVLIDSFRGAMREALPARPEVVKMNWQEFEWAFEEEVPTLARLKLRAAATFDERALAALVLTCGADGMLAFTPEGFYHARPPRLDPVNATGAGDAASAVLAWRLSAGDGWPEALRQAVAVSAAVVLTEATAECRSDDVERLRPQVLVDRFEVTDG